MFCLAKTQLRFSDNVCVSCWLYEMKVLMNSMIQPLTIVVKTFSINKKINLY